MAHTEVSAPTKKRILQTCVRMFLEKGYKALEKSSPPTCRA